MHWQAFISVTGMNLEGKKRFALGVDDGGVR
jgi:hypothetical protein